MTNDVVFLEYVFNPKKQNGDVYDRLRSLGYHCRSRHLNGVTEVWTQRRSIFLVRKDFNLEKPSGVYGIGVLTENHPMDFVNEVYFDEDTEFYVHEDDNGFRLYFVENKEFTNSYIAVDFNDNSTSGIQANSGAVLKTDSNNLFNVIKTIAKRSETSEKYTKFVFNNNFTLFFEKGNTNKITKIIAESSDVFQTTSFMTLHDVDLLEFDDNNVQDFGNLSHKIIGYNCKAFGNRSSYSIENYIPAKDFNVDIIFRTRKQYLKINEHTLDFYEKYDIS